MEDKKKKKLNDITLEEFEEIIAVTNAKLPLKAVR